MNNWLLISILIIVIIFNLNLSTTENFDNNYKEKINSLIKQIDNNISKLQKLIDKRKNHVDKIKKNGERKQYAAEQIRKVKYSDKARVKNLVDALS